MTIQRIAASVKTPLVNAVETSSVNILHRIQALVCRINAQLSRLSEETQSRSQNMKKEYRVSSEKAASLQQRIGNFAPITSTVSLLALFATPEIGRRLHVPEELSMNFSRSIVDQAIPGLGQLFTSHFSAQQMRAQSVSSLRQTEISNEGTKSGEARDLQSELQQILTNIRDLYKKASG